MRVVHEGNGKMKSQYRSREFGESIVTIRTIQQHQKVFPRGAVLASSGGYLVDPRVAFFSPLKVVCCSVFVLSQNLQHLRRSVDTQFMRVMFFTDLVAR